MTFSMQGQEHLDIKYKKMFDPLRIKQAADE